MYHYFILLCVLAASFTGAQRIVTNSQVVRIGSAAATCGSDLTLLTSSSSACLVRTNSQGVSNSSSCPAEFLNANSVYCLADICFASNPVSHSVHVFKNDNSGTVLETFGASSFVSPTFVTAYDVPAALTHIFVSEFSGTQVSVWYIKRSATAVTSITPVLTISSSNDIAGLVVTSTTRFMVALKHSQTMSVYSYTGTLQSTFATTVVFSSIELLSQDYLGNLYVYDSGCSCVKVLSSTGDQIDSWNLQSPAIAMSHSRSGHYVVDSVGVLNKFNDITLVSYTATNSTCSDLGGGSISVVVSGGSPPYTYITKPVFASRVVKTQTSHTFTDLSSFVPYLDKFSLYDEGFNPVINVGTVSMLDKMSTDITPHSGNYSASMIFDAGADFYYYCATCFDAKFFHTLELWLNPGLGGQSFSISLGFSYVLQFKPGDLPLNSWTKVEFDLNRGLAASFYTLDFRTNGAPSYNPLYMDSMTEIPRADAAPSAFVYDFCSVSVSTPRTVISEENELKASVLMVPTTCNAAYDAKKALDGSISVQPSGGVAPYTYSWSFNSSTTTEVTDLPQMRSNILIFGESINASWIAFGPALTFDNAPGLILQDDTYFKSAPYSYSFAPTKGSDNICFNSQTELVAAEYDAFEFWMFTGEGGQSLGTVICKGLTQWVSVTGFYTTINTYVGLPILPPNQWFKVRVPIDVYTPTFTGFFVVGVVDMPQNRVYFDDIALISKELAVTVTDSVGCSITNYHIQIDSPAVITPALTPSNVKCHGSADGSVEFSVSGGTAPYQYSWSAGTVNYTSNVASSIARSIVYVNVTDVNGCHSPMASTLLYEPSAIEVTSTVAPAKCFGGTGTVTTSAMGGAGIYTYKWNSPSDSNYSVVLQPNPMPIFSDSMSPEVALMNGTVRLRRVCEGTGPYNLTSADRAVVGYCTLLRPAPNATQLALPRNNDTIVGFGYLIDMTIISGVSLYIYAENPQYLSNMTLSTLKAGKQVANPFWLGNTSFSSTNQWHKYDYIFENRTGAIADTILLQSSGIVPGYILLDNIYFIPTVATSYSLVTGVGVNQGFKSIIAASAGTYTLSVTDANNCPLVRTFNVTQPLKLALQSIIQAASTSSDADGSISVNATGGTPPYLFLWPELNSNQSTVVGLAYGAHAVIVTDANGCTLETTLYVQLAELPKLRKYNSALSIALGAVTGVCVIIGIFGIVMIGVFWSSHRGLGTFYSSTITLGVLVSYAAVLTLLPRPTDALCTAFPWLLGISFNLVYACLFLKTWALYRVWTKAINYQKSTLKPFHIIRTIAIALVVEIAILGAWTSSDPPRVHLVKVVNNTLEEQCNTNHPTFWIIFLVVKGVWLLFGAILSVLTRNITKEYNESSNIAYAIYNILVLLVIAVPLATLLQVVPGGRLVIEVVVPLLVFTSTLVIMFFKIWHRNLFGEVEIKLGAGSRVGQSSGANRTPTPIGSWNSSSSVSSVTVSSSHSA